MRYTCYILCLLLLPVISHAQSAELKERIATYHFLHRLSYEQKYDSVIVIGTKQAFRDSFYLYSTEGFVAEAYLHKGDTIKAMNYLARSIVNQDVKALENMHYGYKDFHLDSNKHYQYLQQHFYELHSTYNNKLHTPILNDCMEIYNTDSRLRWLIMQIEGEKAKGAWQDTTVLRTAELLLWRSDSMNVLSMKNIFRKYGRFPGISDIGKAFQSNFLHIISHFASHLPQDTLNSFLKTAIRKGEVPNWYGPFMLDKTEWYAKRPLIYGEFGTSSNYIDEVYHYSDIRDIDEVDKRRAEFLLLPLYKELETRKAVLPKGYDPKRQRGTGI